MKDNNPDTEPVFVKEAPHEMRLAREVMRLRKSLERVKRVACGEDQLEDHIAVDDTETLAYLYRFCVETLADGRR